MSTSCWFYPEEKNDKTWYKVEKNRIKETVNGIIFSKARYLFCGSIVHQIAILKIETDINDPDTLKKLYIGWFMKSAKPISE